MGDTHRLYYTDSRLTSFIVEAGSSRRPPSWL